MEVCDAALVDRTVPERKTNRILNRIYRDKEHNRTNQIKIEVNHCSTARIFRTTQRGQERGNTGTDVLTKDNRDGCGIADCARCRQRLQNTNRCRGRLNNRSDTCTHQHAKHRVCDRGKQLRKLRPIRQRRNRAFHHRHTDKQYTETGKNIRNIASTALFGQHHDNDTHQDNHIGQILRLEHLHHQILADCTAAVQTQDLRGDRRTDIRAQNNANRLPQRHNTRVNKTDHHNSRR